MADRSESSAIPCDGAATFGDATAELRATPIGDRCSTLQSVTSVGRFCMTHLRTLSMSTKPDTSKTMVQFVKQAPTKNTFSSSVAADHRPRAL